MGGLNTEWPPSPSAFDDDVQDGVGAGTFFISHAHADGWGGDIVDARCRVCGAESDVLVRVWWLLPPRCRGQAERGSVSRLRSWPTALPSREKVGQSGHR